MLTKSILGLSLAACFTLPTWADTTQWGRWSTIRFPARVREMLATGFYARTPSGSDVYIRQDQRVFRDGQLVNPAFLGLGDNIQVVVPAGQGQIRYRDDDVAMLSTPQGLAQVPEENLQLAYHNPYTTTAPQPARSSSSNSYLSTPNSGDSYSSENFYAPTPTYSYNPTPNYAASYRPYAYNDSNPNGSFNWEGAAVSLLGTVLANTLSPANYNNAYNNPIGYSQGYYDYSSAYNQTYSPNAYNQGYPTPSNYNYNYANYSNSVYTYGANNFQPQFQVSNWIPNNTWIGPQVRMNGYRPLIQQPRISKRTKVNYSRPQYRPQQNFPGGGGGFRSAPQQRNFNPGGGRGGGHHNRGSHGKGKH